MTVAELIEKLRALPQDLPVQFLDYEQGPCDVECVETDQAHYAGASPDFNGKPLQRDKASAVWLS